MADCPTRKIGRSGRWFVKTSLRPAQVKIGLAIAGPLLLAGVFAWMGLAGLAQKQAEALDLAERMGDPALAALLGDPAGISRAAREAAELANLTKLLGESDEGRISQWAQGTREATGEGEAWSKDPGKWKDRLIEIQSGLQKKAAAGNVRLPPDFYLGLDDFRQRSPAVEEVPRLALHLAVAQRLVELFIAARHTAEQYPTVGEFQSLSGPGSEKEKMEEPPPSAPAVKPGPASIRPIPEPFLVEMRCSPEVLYDYVGRLTRDPWLFLVRDIRVSNEKQTFPLRSEIAKRFSENNETEPNAKEPNTKKKKLLEILAGEESLAVQMRVEFVPWRMAEAPPRETSPSPKP